MANPIIEEGQKAPDFKALADDDTEVALSDFAGKNVVLYFYPKDNTSGCTKEACDFRDRIESLAEANTVVLGVSPDSIKSHKNFKAKYDLNFTLLSDPDKELANSYGVFREKKLYGKVHMGIVRSTFLIDENGQIAKVWDNVRVHRKKKGEIFRHVDDVREAIAAL